MHHIAKLDQFGAQFYPRIKEKKNIYQTTLGGLFTFGLYSLALAYFIYIISTWLQGKILPNVSVQTKGIEYFEFNHQGKSPFSIQLLVPPQFILNPFGNVKNIFTVYKIGVSETSFSKPIAIFPELEGIEAGGIISQYDNYTLNIQSNSQERKPQFQEFIIIGLCDQDYLPEGGSCASEEDQKLFFQMNPFLALNLRIYLDQFDFMNNRFEYIMKDNYMMLDTNSLSYNQVILRSGLASINDGYIFSQTTNKNILSNVQLVSQSISQKYILDLFQIDKSIMVFLFRIDTLQDIVNIQFPLIGNILANIQSILSVLFLAGMLMKLINEKHLEEYIAIEILSYYIPKFKQLQPSKEQNQKNINNQKDDFELQRLKETFPMLKPSAIKKVNFLNVLYEISRIQFILQHLLSREQIQKIKQVGIEFPQKTDPFQIQNNEQPTVQIEKQSQIYDEDREFLKDEIKSIQDSIIRFPSLRIKKQVDLQIQDIDLLSQENDTFAFEENNKIPEK